MNIQPAIRQIMRDFAWWRQPRYWLLLLMLAGWAAALGV